MSLERKDVAELNESISREKVEKCVKKHKNGKEAAGLDEIPYEMYKNGKVMNNRIELF